MNCYKDKIFCYRECSNMECDLNLKHVPEGVLEPICMAEFMDCEKWRGEDDKVRGMETKRKRKN